MKPVLRSPLLRAGLPALILASLVAAALAACSGQSVLNGLTSERDFQRSQNIPYDANNQLALDVYAPSAQSRRPVVVFFYGKRWSGGTKRDYEFVAGGLASIGYCTVIPDVRLYPAVRFPAFVEDGARVVRWTRERIADYGCDPTKIFVMGHNSGAHIAAMLALNEKYLQAVGGSRAWLRGFVGLGGPYNFMPFNDPMLRDLFGPADRFEQSQPIMFTDGRNPPTLLMHGEDDELVPIANSRSLADSIARSGGAVETVFYPKMPNPRLLTALGPVMRGQSDVINQIDAFLQKWSNANWVNQANQPGIIGVPLP